MDILLWFMQKPAKMVQERNACFVSNDDIFTFPISKGHLLKDKPMLLLCFLKYEK